VDPIHLLVYSFLDSSLSFSSIPSFSFLISNSTPNNNKYTLAICFYLDSPLYASLNSTSDHCYSIS
jgi:hypothetical protein